MSEQAVSEGNAVRQLVMSVQPVRASGREYGDKDAEPDGAPELVGDVDKPSGSTGVVGSNVCNARGCRPGRCRSRPWAARRR